MLPEDEIRFLQALPTPQMHARLAYLHENGWSLASLARSMNPPRAKTTVHYWVRNSSNSFEQRRALPEAPAKSIMCVIPSLKPVKVRSIAPKVPPDLRDQLRELADASKKYRARTPPNAPSAVANRTLTNIAFELYSTGVPVADIASAAGITYRAMSRRIKNYGAEQS